MNLIRKNREFFLILLDVIIIVISYLSAYFMRIDIFENYQFIIILKFIPIAILLNLVISQFLGNYKSMWRYTSSSDVARLGISSIIANGLWFLIIILIPKINYIRSIPLIATMLILLTQLLVRFIYKSLINGNNPDNLENALIIGAGDAGAILLKELQISNKYNCKVIGFIDDSPLKQQKIIAGIQILGKVEDLDVISKKFKVDIVYIAIKNATKEQLNTIIERCRELSLKTKILYFREEEFDKPIIRDVSIEDLLGRGEICLETDKLNDEFNDRIVMVTGAGGSIGSELCRQILRFKPSKLIMVDIYENNMYALQQEIIMLQRKEKSVATEIICLIGSVRDEKRINEIMSTCHPDYVYHAAAHKHVPLVEDSPEEALKNNVLGTYNLVKCSINNNVKRFTLISTDKAVNPTNVMGATKRLCELVVQGYKDNGITKLSAVRFGNVLGSNGSVIPLFKEQIQNGGPVTVTDPDIQRYFMTIKEAAQLVIQSSIYSDNGEIFVLDMGNPVKILKLAEDLISLSGFQPYKDIDIIFTGLRPGEKMFEELILGNEGYYKTNNNLIFITKPNQITSDELESIICSIQDIIKLNESNEIVKEKVMHIIRQY